MKKLFVRIGKSISNCLVNKGTIIEASNELSRFKGHHVDINSLNAGAPLHIIGDWSTEGVIERIERITSEQ